MRLLFHKILIVIIFLLLISQSAFSQSEYPNLDDQSGGITDGYGTWGNHTITKENSVSVPDKGIITFYHPNETPSKRATVFFISGWGRQAETYDKFFRFIVSHGYSLINIYNNDDPDDPGYVGNISTSYPNIIDMIKQSVILYPNWIDTTKVGLMGHSFGGGATIWVGDSLFNSKTNWGTNGRFIFTTAPWLSFLETREDLENYPPDVKLHIQVSMDEVVSNDDTSHWTWLTDPRAIRAVFELINIPDDDKDYIRVFSDKNRSYQYNGETYTYDADHYISYTQAYSYHSTYSQYEPYDEMDVYVINRLAHAMMDYVFEGNENAKTVALGNGSNEQINNGELPDLEETDRPVITRPVDEFKYTCYDGWDSESWKLEKYCDDADGDGLIDSLEATENIVYLKCKVFLEGPYDVNNQMITVLNVPFTSPYQEDPRTINLIPDDIVDWVLVQLKKTPDGLPVTSKSFLLRKDGYLVDDDGTTLTVQLNAPDDNYYIIIKHRNHLAIMSSNPQAFGSASAAHFNVFGNK